MYHLCMSPHLKVSEMEKGVFFLICVLLQCSEQKQL